MLCRICQATALKEVMDFGAVALAGGFIKASQFPTEQRYPLRLMFCEHCFAVQIEQPVAAETLFTDYFYFTGKTRTAREHFKAYADDVSSRFKPKRVLEIGCNDGCFLGHLADAGVTCIGVDPAKNVLYSIKDGRLRLVNSFFNEAAAQTILAEEGLQDMVVANNVFAHIPDLHGVTEAIKTVLADDGVLVIETHHLAEMVAGLQYDWIYHEHLFYWSALALAMHLNRHGLHIFDVKPIDLHGGSMRYYICRQGHRVASPAVAALLARERRLGLDILDTFLNFADRAEAHRKHMIGLVQWVLDQGQTLAGYGASGRANAMLQYWGLDARHLMFMLDDAPAKHGFYTPGSHLPIYPPDSPKAVKPTYMLVLAWPYADEILPKVDGGAIVPLPSVRFHEAEKVVA